MTDSFDTCAPAVDGNDLDLARRVAAGDPAAFEGMMRRHNRRLYRLARAILRDDAEAEDALQAVYLSAYRSIARFRGDATLLTWLSRLMLNECFARVRRARRRSDLAPTLDVDGQLDEDDMIDISSDSPERAASRAELRDLLERRIDALPPVFRVVFVLRSVEEMTVEETAHCLALPEATVRSRHHRARRMLRASLAQDLDLAERDAFDFCGAQCDRVVARVLSLIADPASSANGRNP
ncbi:RNA polymerase, sigma-24 subunit, ECF subfamily [Burkholderia sp. lig30]|jgi:RNA polymerase sigma-70 factor (ECF subfamily)|uniref:RNA polymerase sigma factor n=1 Tax=Burkholderia sp. lig30 TaxID=1192124 RepID=UPI0004618346|nr:RNA polymerase sigma factor [Burkholderia sp. lig30]KDB06490.1 RNA polymerase, sigma-24 subunit, ECF subfamily [Burkholderia sp. lig30]